MTPHRGTQILIMGLAGFLGIVPLAPVAWWMGTKDVLAMGEGTMDRSGKTATEIGRFLGMFTTMIWLVALAGGVVLNLINAS